MSYWKKNIPPLAEQHKKNLQKTEMLHLLKMAGIPAKKPLYVEKDDGQLLRWATRSVAHHFFAVGGQIDSEKH